MNISDHLVPDPQEGMTFTIYFEAVDGRWIPTSTGLDNLETGETRWGPVDVQDRAVAAKQQDREGLVGETVIFLEPMSAWSKVMQRGEEVVLTKPLILETVDRNGDSWLDLLDDLAAQSARWGSPQFTRDASMAPSTSWRWGDPDWEQQRDSARQQALSYPEGSEQRREAMAEVSGLFGGPPVSTFNGTRLKKAKPDTWASR